MKHQSVLSFGRPLLRAASRGLNARTPRRGCRSVSLALDQLMSQFFDGR